MASSESELDETPHRAQNMTVSMPKSQRAE